MHRLLALAVLAFLSCGWIGMGGRVSAVTVPASANIPVTSLATGNYAANFWTGFTTPATTISTVSGYKFINVSSGGYTSNTLAIGTADWFDQEVTFYYTQGRTILRGTAAGSGIVMSIGIGGGGGLRFGMLNSINYSDPEGGTVNQVYLNTTPAACIANWPTDASHTFTFGVKGFSVYLLIDGQPAYDTCQSTVLNPLGELRYSEYRTPVSGKASVWGHSNGSRDITVNYFAPTIVSNVATKTFDAQDFGLRSIPAVTGSMSAASCTLTLSGARDFRVRDQVIVEIGGEAGAGGRNTVGVGGSSPELNYVDLTAMNADHTQLQGTYAYDASTGLAYRWDAAGAGTWWSQAQSDVGVGTYAAGTTYYAVYKAPVSLRAVVVAVNASPATTLTLKTFGADLNPTCAKVATTGANVYLDNTQGFYPISTNPAETFVTGTTNGLTAFTNMIFRIPAGNWSVGSKVNISGSGIRSGLTVSGQSAASTNLFSPKGSPSILFESGTGNDSLTFQDYTSTGNVDDAGYLWDYGTANKNYGGTTGDSPIATYLKAGTSNKVQRLKCVNTARGCAVLEGTSPQILNSEVVMTVGQRAYFQWQFLLSNCNGGQINGITATGLYLLKSVELFACSGGAAVTNVTGTNVLLSSNSTTNPTYSNIDVTITTDAFFNQASGWLDEPIVNINRNAFPMGGAFGGTLSNFRIVQAGYTQVSSTRNLKTIQISHVGLTDWTISGGYPGGGGCTTALGGFAQTPDYNIGGSGAGSNYGAMLIYSDAPRTIVQNVRIKGTAISTPGHSSHYGNISLTGANSQINNSVADVLQNTGSGSSSTGNQTNAAYGGC